MLPRLSLVAGAEVNAPNPRAFAASDLVGVPAWDVTLQLEWSLSAVTQGSARRAAAVAEREALRARAEELRRQLDALRKGAVATRSSAEARVLASRSAVVTAIRLAEIRSDEFAAGLGTPLEVTNAEAERVRAELELRLADARLAYAAGYVPTTGREE
jgi:outer membrane protein TolC